MPAIESVADGVATVKFTPAGTPRLHGAQAELIQSPHALLAERSATPVHVFPVSAVVSAPMLAGIEVRTQPPLATEAPAR